MRDAITNHCLRLLTLGALLAAWVLLEIAFNV